MREYISTGILEDVVDIMSEQSDEAKKIINMLIEKEVDKWKALQLLLAADDMNIRGEQFVAAYTVFYHKQQQPLKDAILNRDLNLVTFLNSAYADPEYRAVQQGAFRFGKYKMPEGAAGMIYVLNHAWQVLYKIPSGTTLRLIDMAGNQRDIILSYLDEYHFRISNRIWEVHEFGVMLMRRCLKCYPVIDEKHVAYNGMYTPPKNEKERRKFLKTVPMR